eukprot:4913307-Alexandrium_andersonii.AAC.1
MWGGARGREPRRRNGRQRRLDSALARRLIEAAGGDAARVADVRRLLAQARTGDSPGEGEGEGRAREPRA